MVIFDESQNHFKGSNNLIKNDVEIQIEKSIKIVWSDWGSEYLYRVFQDYLKDNKILP